MCRLLKPVSALVLGIALAGLNDLHGQQAAEPPESDLQRQIREAKEQGLEKIDLGLTITEPGFIRSLDVAVDNYDIIIATAAGRDVVLYDGDYARITTWYKFRTNRFIVRQKDRLTHRSSRMAKRPLSSFQLPPSLLPLAPQEFLLGMPGGTVSVDGISLKHSADGAPRFEMGSTYLLIAQFTDLEDRVAVLPALGHCVFHIRGDELVPVIPSTRNPLAFDILALYRGSLTRLELALSLRP